VLTKAVVVDKISSSVNLSSTEGRSAANATDGGISDPKTPASPRQPTRRPIVSSPVGGDIRPEEPAVGLTDGAATAINFARKELGHYQLLCDNDFLLWRQQDDYWRVNTIDYLEQIGRDLAYIMSADGRTLRHDLFALHTELKDFQNRHGLPTSREAWYELRRRSVTAVQYFTSENEYQKLEPIGATTPTTAEHATNEESSGRKTKPRKDVAHGQHIPQSYWGDHRGLLCYEYNDNGWKLVSAWPDLKAGSRLRKYEGLPNYDQFNNMLRILYRNSNGETKSEIRPEPNWKDSVAVAQSMKLAQQSIRRFLGVGSREPRDRYLPQEINFIADYIRNDVGHDWQHTPENSKHVTKLIDSVNAKFEGKRLTLTNGKLSTARPHRAKFGIINKINRDPTILDARGKETKPEATKKKRKTDDKTQIGSNKKQKTNDESSSDTSISINGGHGMQHKETRLILKNQKMNNTPDVAGEEDVSSESADADDYDE